MNNCDEFRDLMSEYIDDELDSKILFSFENHINSCESCMEELNQLKQTILAVNSLEQIELPTNFARETIKRIKDETIPINLVNIKRREIRKRKLKKQKIVREINRRDAIWFANAVATIFILYFMSDGVLKLMNGTVKPSETTVTTEIPIESRAFSNEVSGDHMQQTFRHISERAVPDTIISYEIQLEVTNLEEALEVINTLEGYNTNELIYNMNQPAHTDSEHLKRGADITRRISIENYDYARNTLKQLGVTISEFEDQQRIDVQNFNTKIKLDAKEQEFNRLLSLLEMNNTVQGMIEIQKRLLVLEDEIDNYKLILNRNSEEAMSPNVSIRLVEEKNELDENRSIFSKMGTAFSNSAKSIVFVLQQAVLLVSILIVPLTLVTIIGVAYLFISNKAKRRDGNEK